MYMYECENKNLVRQCVARQLKNFQLPVDNKIIAGKVKGYGTPKKNSVFQITPQTDQMFPVPKIFHVLSKFIIEHVDEEGIFRKAGSKTKQDNMKKKIAKKQSWDCNDIDVVDAAALLKYYIRELPVPLIPYQYHELFLASCNVRNKEEALVLATLLLPTENLNLLSYLMIVFNQVTTFSKQNKMNSYNLAVCVAPNILPIRELSAEISSKTNEIVKILIDYADDIGAIPLHIQEQLNTEQKNSTSKLKVYFISFKQKMRSLLC